MKLSRWDDYLIHQVARPMDTLGTDDPNFMDRLWFMAYTADGKLQMMAGLGSHTNKGLMDAFLLIRYEGAQRNIRLSRHLNADRSHSLIGPLCFEIVEPLQHWLIRLDANEYGLACMLDFRARSVPFLFPPLDFKEQGQLHYKQPGYCTGTMTFEGKVFELQAVPAVRDRSWGARKPGIVSGLSMMVVFEAQFATQSATLIYFDSTGNDFRMRQGALLGDDGSVEEIVEMRQSVTFEAGTQRFTKVIMELENRDGRKRTMTATAISDLCYFSGGGYDGRHGKDYGPFHMEGERWNVADPSAVNTVFPYYSRIARFDLDGEPGIGHVEAFFSQSKDWIYTSTL